jgi:RNA polymerase sigma factor (sigma-70 family)
MNNYFSSLEEMLQEYNNELTRYCKLIASSSWDAEDLYQTTLAKIYKSMSKKGGEPISKAYLFRVATNAWIDICRRQKFSWDKLEDHHMSSSSNPLMIRESIEELFDKLTPQQACILLLVDIFLFSARETAEMVCSTEGAVKAVLHRARTQIKKASDKKRFSAPQSNVRGLIETFIDAFNTYNAEMISQTYILLKSNGYQVIPVVDAQVLFFRCKDPEGNVFLIYEDGILESSAQNK